MAKAVKVEGFNAKEQRIYEMFAKTPGESCSIAELTQLFMKEAKRDKGKAQSFVRNSLRRLIRDGWIRKIGYGTYSLTTDGRQWVKTGKAKTESIARKKGRPTKKAAAKKKAAKKKKSTRKKKTNGQPSVRLCPGAGESRPVKVPPKIRRAKNREARREIGPDAAKERARELARQIAQEEQASA